MPKQPQTDRHGGAQLCLGVRRRARRGERSGRERRSGDSASVFFNLLPYLEQEAVYNSAAGPGQNQIVAVFMCPSDSTGNGTLRPGAGTAALALGSVRFPRTSPCRAIPMAACSLPRPCRRPGCALSKRWPMAPRLPSWWASTSVVRRLGGRGRHGAGGTNPWGTIANKRVFGSTALGCGEDVGGWRECKSMCAPARSARGGRVVFDRASKLAELSHGRWFGSELLRERRCDQRVGPGPYRGRRGCLQWILSHKIFSTNLRIRARF